MANEEQNEDDAWDLRMRQEEEEDFFTELALHETERWISAVTRKKFAYPDDFRRSLENGVLLCELLNTIKPGSIKRINKLPGPIAGLDNINVFLQTCRTSFHLNEAHLFDGTDLEDLSQRAISESQHILKQESDRRARNVAIGIYWLGKSVYNTYSGPHLDFSAFTPLVHHNGKDLISEEQFHQDICEYGEQSSSYGLHELQDSVGKSFDTKHIRDSAYDSYGSLSNSRESELSFSLEEANMPGVQMRRADSTSSINRSGDFSLARHSEDDSLYQSTPDLSLRNSHTRTSSTDSMDGHSRQSSEGTNVSIPTRSTERKSSTANANPLQFVKVNSSNDMAKVATMQIKMSEEVKKVRTKIDNDEQEWQSNFSDWRNKRRRKSEAQLQRVEETDKNVKEEEEKKQVKSYGQMVEERERRKSTGTFLKKPMSFYPVDDDDGLFTSVKVPASAAPVEEVLEKKSVSEVKSEAPLRQRAKAPMLSPKDRSSSVGSDTYIHYDDTKRASWAASDSSDEESSKKDNSVESNRLQDTSKHENKNKSNSRSRVLDSSDNSWRRKDPSPPRKSGLPGAGTPNKSTGKLSSLLKSFEQKEEEAKADYSKVKKISETSADFSRSGLKKMSSFDHPSSSFSFSAKDKAENTALRSTITDKTVPVPTKASVEKSIKISQKPNNLKGFGFVISGGVDKREPITVQKVSLGSAADVCEVQQGDKILAINKRDISALAQAQVQRLIDEAVRHGQIEVKVKRTISDGDEEDEDDDAFVAKSPTSPVPKLASALSPRLRGSSGSSGSSQGQNSVSKSPSGYVSPSSGDRYGGGTRAENRFSSVSPIRSQRTQSPGAIKSESYRRSASPVETKNTTNSFLTETSHRSGSPLRNQNSSASPTESRQTHSTPNNRNTPGSVPPSRRDPSPVTTRKAYTQEDRTGSPLQRSSPLFKSPSENLSRPSDSKVFHAERSRFEQETNNNEVKVNSVKTELIKPPSPVDNGPGVAETITPVKKEMDFSRPVQHDVMSLQKAPEMETIPKQEVTISTRETITVKKKEPSETKSSYKWEPPASPPISSSPPPAAEEEDEGGPPAILRRWQQRKPRPQSAYSAYPAYEPPKEEKRLSATFPWESSIISTDKKNDAEQDMETQVIKLDHQENNSIPPPKTQVGQPVTLEIPDHNEAPAKTTSVKLVSSYNPGLLQIDPRNQVTENDINLPEYSFHVNINKTEQAEPRTLSSPATIERERELIRQEEQKILEAEKKQWEEDEKRRIKEKEEDLQRQAELLRQEKEKLREEQQRMQREREELERSKKNQIETKENKKPESRVFQTHQNNNPKSQFAVNTDSKQSLRKLDLTWPPQKEEPPPRQKLTREDMLAMNRRATPLQRKPEVEVNSSEPSKTKDFSTSREAPTKNDLHNLTAVPKPKYRASGNWMKEDQQPQKTVSKSRSDNNRSSPNLHEHWLVEEAERRRKATTNQNSHSSHSGAIQPVSDGIVNRWRDDSFVPKQQASVNAHGSNLTQPRSLSSNVSHGLDNRQYIPASQNTKAMSQTLPQNFNYSSLSPKHRGDPYAPPKPTRTSSSSTASSMSSPSSPLNPSEQFMAVSGKQACSYCNQELGFGAAMVIESLGLYYHVQCFRCCVCHAALGNGSQGADVRVRVNKLHCRNCYSNDEAGLKFSKV